MESSILIGTVIAVLVGLAVIFLLSRMIITGDYSLLVKEREEITPAYAESELTDDSASRRPSAPAPRRAPAFGTQVHGLALNVAHFMHELPVFKHTSDREKLGKGLAAVRELHDTESRDDQSGRVE